jgi:HSP20 family molecular chaperone IbpA
MTIPKGKSKRRSRFPEGMTERKAKANANTGVSPLRITKTRT